MTSSPPRPLGGDRRDGQEGFTLVELVVALTVLAIILVPLTAAFIASIQQTQAVDDRLAQSADAQRIAEAWTGDVRSVSATGFDTAGTCPDPVGDEGGELLTSFEWDTDPSAGGIVKKASWIIEGTGPNAQLVRRYCEGGAAVREDLLADSFGVTGLQPLEAIHSLNGPFDRRVCNRDTCTIVVDGAFKYQLTVARGVPGNDVGTTCLPPAPVINGATVGNGSITASWSPSILPACSPPVTNYRMIVTNNVGNTVNGAGLLTDGVTTTGQVTGLTNGSDYWVQVQAGVSGTWGPLSQPPYGPLVPTATTPGAPTAVTSTRGDQSLIVGWGAPTENGGATITDWHLRARNADTGELVERTVSGGSSATITGLANGTLYNVSVAAINSAGEGPESDPLQAPLITAADNQCPESATASRPCTKPAGLPSAPGQRDSDGFDHQTPDVAPPAGWVGPSVSTQGDVVTVSWDEPWANGANILRYKVYSNPPFVSSNPLYPSSPWTVTAPAPVNPPADPPVVRRISFTTPPLGTASHTFTVSAVNGVGEGAPSVPSAATAALSRPIVAPGDIQALPLDLNGDNTHKGIKVSWVPLPDDPAYNGGSPITSYKVSLTPNDNSNVNTFTVNGGNSDHLDIGNLTQLTGLGNLVSPFAYKPYTIKVQAVNQIGPGLENPADPDNDATASVVAIPGGVPITSPAPLTTSPLGLTSNGDAAVRVAWTPVDNTQANNGDNTICDGTLGLRGYKVTWSPPSTDGQSSFLADGCFNANGDIGNLVRGTTYTFKVHTLNRRGSSIPATSVVVPAPKPMSTSYPSGLAVSRPAGPEGNRLSLFVPNLQANSGSAVPDYSATCTTTSGSPVRTASFTALTVGTNLLTDPALENGRTYNCKLTAVATYPSSGADTVNFTTSNTAKVFAAPTAPGTPVVTGQAAGKAKVDWTAPASDGGDPITSYVVTTTPAISGSPFTLGNVLTWTSPSLTFGTSYTFSVKAVNGCGCSGGPESTSAPHAPSSSLPAVAPTNLAWTPTVTGAAPPTTPNTGMNVTWTAIPGDGASTGGLPVTGYKVTVTQDQTPFTAVTTTVAGTATSASFTNLPQLTTSPVGYRTYTVTVAAVNANGNGPNANLTGAKAGGIPLASPTGLIIEPFNQNGAVRLKFTPPPFDAVSGGGTMPSGYRIYWRQGVGAESAGYSIGGAQFQTDLGFATNTTYTLRIAMESAYGVSLTTEVKTFTTPGPITAPVPPLLTPSVSSGRLTLTVTGYNTSASTPPVTSYDATCTSSNGGVSWGPQPVSVNGNAISGLTPGKSYTCVVTGTSPGWATGSQTHSVTTNAATVP
ncbi:MAG: fibronectin type protein [Acidimicrobiales bacterium]|nr:fibronectin type protein [Acidimicrobiales bacterium]